MRAGLSQAQLDALLRRVSQITDSRVTMLGVRPGQRAPAFVVADSELERGPLAKRLRRGHRGRSGPRRGGRGRVARPGSAPPRSRCRSRRATRPGSRSSPSPLGEVDDNVALIKRQILIAGGIALVLALIAGFYAARALSRRLEPARERRPEGRRRRLRDSDPGRLLRRARPAGADLQRDAAPARRPRQRPQAVHRQRLARAANADLLPRRLRRAARGRGPRPGGPGRVRPHDARAGRAADQADHRPARPLEARRRRAGGLRRASRPRRARPRGRRASSARPRTGAARGSRCGPRASAALALADPDRVRQIIRILLDNALTHTPEGTKVTVTTYNEKRPRRADRLRRGARHPEADPATDVRALLHRRLGQRLGPRPGDRRASSRSGWGADRGHLEQGLHRVHARPAAVTRRPLPRASPRSRPARERQPPGAGRASCGAWRLRLLAAAAVLAGCGGSGGGTTTVTVDTGRTPRRRRRSSCRPRTPASTRPRSTGRTRPGWSRSARSSAAASGVLSAAPQRRGGLGLRPQQGRRDRHQRSRRHRGQRRRTASEADQVYVEFPDRNIVPADILGFDPFADVALLKVEPDGLELHPLDAGQRQGPGRRSAGRGDRQSLRRAAVPLGRGRLGRPTDPSSR